MRSLWVRGEGDVSGRPGYAEVTMECSAADADAAACRMDSGRRGRKETGRAAASVRSE